MSLLLTTLLIDQEEGPLLFRVNGPVGGEEGTRTPTPFRAHDPKSCSSANSDTSPESTRPFRQTGDCIRTGSRRRGGDSNPRLPEGVRDFQSRALGQAMRPLQGTRA